MVAVRGCLHPRRHWWLVVVFCGLLTLGRAYGQGIADIAQFESKTVRRVDFEPQDQPLLPKELLERIALHEGQPFENKLLRESIASLYASGKYADISVDGSVENDGVAIRFITKTAYFVGQVSIQGVKGPPNESQMATATKLTLGNRYADSDIVRAKEAIVGILRQNGFYSAVVTSTASKNDRTGQIDLRFVVDSAGRAKYERPDIKGDLDRLETKVIRETGWQRIYGLLGWHEVTSRRTQQGLDNIRESYRDKGYLRSRITLRSLQYKEATNTVKPTVDVTVGPGIVIRARGFRLGRTKLRQLIPVYQERTADRDLLVEGQGNIERYLESQGYFDAEVTFRSEASGDKRIITYQIEEGARHRLKHLLITGNNYFTLETLRERMNIQPTEFPRFPRGRFSEDDLGRDLQAIRDLYRSNGFRDVKVDSRIDERYQGKDNQLALYITIDEGQQSFISDLEMEGVTPDVERELRARLTSGAGQPLSTGNLASDQEAVLNYFYDNGYENCLAEYRIEHIANSNQSKIHFTIAPGQRRFVRGILVSGLETTKPKLVYSRIFLKPGAPVSLRLNTESQRRLYDLGVFARVNTAVQNPDGDETNKYVLYDLEEARHYSLNVGVGAEIARIGGGVTTLDAPAGRAGFSPRLTFGISRINFLGLGQTLGIQTRVSNIQQRAVLTHYVPEFTGNPNLSSTATLLFDNSSGVRTFTARRREASVQLNQRVSKATSLQYRLVFRRVTQSNLRVDPLLVPLFSQPVTVGQLGLSFIQDKRDDPTDAHRGSYSSIDMGYAARFLWSQTEFGRLLVKNSTYYPLSRGFTLARNTQFGIIARFSGGPEIPLPERFFSGGSTAMRAFPDFQAGPRDLTTGFPLGGSALLMNQTELRFPLSGQNLGGVLFHDMGNVFDNVRDISFRFRQRDLRDFNYMVQSLGFGIRYKTPIGPFRVDLSLSPNAPRFFGLRGTVQDFINGTAIRTTQKINGFQFHISLGQAF